MKKKSKNKWIMVSSIISLFLSMILLTTVSLAWLSMNLETSSEGMKLKVEITPNLIIDDSTSDIAAVTNPTIENFTHTFTAGATAKKPATHDWSVGTATGLKYVNNPTNVGVSSGVAKTGSLTFSAVPSANPSDYYVDYTVYIASTNVAMSGMDLTAALLPVATMPDGGANKQDTLDATSIDFYIGSVSSGNFKGTLNVKGYDASTNNYTATKTTVTLVENGPIPLNTSEYITVIMRCYFDGALLKGANQAFINSAVVDVHDVIINVTFTASEH